MSVKQKFKWMAGAMLATVSSIASAAIINVGGVTWDPDNDFDFVTQGNMYEYLFGPSQTQMHGYGLVTQLNDSASQSDFCSNCQLTYTFGGFNLINSTPTNLVFDGGWVKFWVQDKNSPTYTKFDGTKPSSASDGTLWLSLVGHKDERFNPDNGNSLGLGTLFGKLDGGALGLGTARGQAGGLLDVVGGIAASHINTNAMVDSFGGFADINFTTTFLPTSKQAVSAGAPPLTGNATFTGNAIPEPTTVFLLGVGLLGLGLSGRRNKQSKA